MPPTAGSLRARSRGQDVAPPEVADLLQQRVRRDHAIPVAIDLFTDRLRERRGQSLVEPRARKDRALATVRIRARGR